MEKSQCYIGAPNGIVLCVDSAGSQELNAKFYHAYSRQPIEVCGMEQLLFEMECFFDSIHFPHPTTNDRFFHEIKQSVNQMGKKEKIMSDEELLSKHGYQGTFIIRVQHRQHSSWQGRITWMDQNKTVYFRSVWEMVKLMANALNTVGGPEDGREEPEWPEDEV